MFWQICSIPSALLLLIRQQNLNIARGYQAQSTLSDGRTFTIGASWSGPHGGKNGEVYNQTTNEWTELNGCLVQPMLTQDAQGN